MNGKEINKFEQVKYSYDEILNTNYKLIINSDYFEKVNNVFEGKKSNEDIDDDEHLEET